MNIYKLKYKDKETAINDLIDKQVYTDKLLYNKGIYAVVEIGLVIDEPALFDEDGNLLSECKYLEGYHYDIMSENTIIFESEIKVKNPKHLFSGH